MPDDTINPRRTGKIARLPRHLREEICRLLDDGQDGETLLTWLNQQPETVTLCSARFAGEMVSHNNLSQWFKGGFQDWKCGREKIERTEDLAWLSQKLAAASGGSLNEGAHGRRRRQDHGRARKRRRQSLIALGRAAATLRGKELDKDKVDLARARNQQRQQVIDLDEKKFQLLFVGKFIDFATNEQAVAIATGKQTREVKTDELLALMFGPRPAEPPS